ncbi:MAG TPA: aldehyde dehydrogenase family protein [Candidatus Polarisedimenticolaceae bacterium]|nr:aldehyde dehydrogenase family protein [Candidatus Polarisedimenticolaceae bacterium]
MLETVPEQEPAEGAAAIDRPAGAAPDLGPAIHPLVDGERAPGTGRLIEVIDPSTGAPFARVACAGPEEIDAAAEAAARASALWRGSPYKQRGEALRRLAAIIYEDRLNLAELIAREQGKPFVEALALELLPALDHLKFITHRAEQYHGGLVVDPRHPYYTHKQAHYLYDALGVVALITPSPLPFAIPLIQSAAALAMGNSVVLKPSERTPLSALRLGELCERAGFPAGVVNVVPAFPEDSLRLAAHPKIDKVFVTGGLVAGQSVMATAGCAPKPVVLALGGKHPAIVAGDADVDRAARGIVWGALANCGQNCGSVERVYVEERVASRFLERVLSEVDRLIVGESMDEGTDVGPMTTDERRREVHRQVGDAIKRGAKLVRGGVMPDGDGYFYPATVILDPPADCSLSRDETLGPVIPITVVESTERAILLANDCDYALTASGWTRSADCAGRLMQGLHAGVVTINDLLYSFGEPAATWSGYRLSGMGQNHGTPGLREMSRQRFVSFDTTVAEAPIFAFPYDETADRVVRSAIEHLHAGRRLQRLRAIGRLLRLKRFRRRVHTRSVLLAKKRQVR